MNYDLYFIETIWPSSKREDFSRYNNTAYNDVRNPSKRMFFSSVVGTFDDENDDVANAPSRCRDGRAGFLRFRDVAAFTQEEDAIAYAERLAEVGEIAAAQGPHGKNYRGKIKVRVVHEVVSTTENVVWTSPTPKPDRFDKLTDAQCREIAQCTDVAQVRAKLRSMLS